MENTMNMMMDIRQTMARDIVNNILDLELCSIDAMLLSKSGVSFVEFSMPQNQVANWRIEDLVFPPVLISIWSEWLTVDSEMNDLFRLNSSISSIRFCVSNRVQNVVRINWKYKLVEQDINVDYGHTR